MCTHVAHVYTGVCLWRPANVRCSLYHHSRPHEPAANCFTFRLSWLATELKRSSATPTPIPSPPKCWCYR